MTQPVPNPTGLFNQYDNVRPYFGEVTLGHIGANAFEQDRVRSYLFYERLYWNTPDTLSVVLRGTDEEPIYLPTPRKLVEAGNRFLSVGWTYSVDGTAGSTEARAATEAVFKNFFKVQKIRAKFARQKRWGLVRGDAVWHITANAKAPTGHRVYLHEVEPQNTFAILEDQNPDLVIGWHLIDLVPDPRDETKQVVRRQTYRKTTGRAYGPSEVTSELAFFELGQWDDRVAPQNPEPKVTPVPHPATKAAFVLPAPINNLPVYLVPNQKQTCQTYGSSEMRGIESVLAGLNQAVSDQDLTLAMQGLGVYFSTAGPPVAADGTPGVFEISPANVVEVPADTTFGRVSGISAGLPGIEHMNFLLKETQASIGVPDIATGTVDVAVAESGIALKLQLAPLLSHNAEKEQDQADEYNTLFKDLVEGWFPAYEGLGVDTGVVVEQKTDDPIPQDNATRFTQILDMVTAVPPIMSVQTAHKELRKIGYDIPTGELDQLQKEAQERQPAVDPVGARVQDELGTGAVPPVGSVNGVPVGVGANGA